MDNIMVPTSKREVLHDLARAAVSEMLHGLESHVTVTIAPDKFRRIVREVFKAIGGDE